MTLYMIIAIAAWFVGPCKWIRPFPSNDPQVLPIKHSLRRLNVSATQNSRFLLDIGLPSLGSPSNSQRHFLFHATTSFVCPTEHLLLDRNTRLLSQKTPGCSKTISSEWMKASASLWRTIFFRVLRCRWLFSGNSGTLLRAIYVAVCGSCTYL